MVHFCAHLHIFLLLFLHRPTCFLIFVDELFKYIFLSITNVICVPLKQFADTCERIISIHLICNTNHCAYLPFIRYCAAYQSVGLQANQTIYHKPILAQRMTVRLDFVKCMKVITLESIQISSRGIRDEYDIHYIRVRMSLLL